MIDCKNCVNYIATSDSCMVMESIDFKSSQCFSPKSTTRPKPIMVFKIGYHNRARLDHTKFPMERSHVLEDSPIFRTRDEADKVCKRLEKKNKENIYFPRTCFVPENELKS